MKRSLPSLVVVLASALSLVTAAPALARAAGTTFENGDVQVVFADSNGVPLTRSLFDGVAVAPGMAPVATTFVVENTGDQAADYTIDVTTTGRSGTGDLVDGLVLSVRDVATNSIAYEGPLDRVHLRGSQPLEPASGATYVVTTTWPSSTDGNRHQQSTVSFDVVLAAVAA